MKTSSKKRSVALILATAFGGGTVFNDCQGMAKDSVVGTIRQTLVSPDTAAAITAALLAGFDTTDNTGG